jgi:hypothetical protein
MLGAALMRVMILQRPGKHKENFEFRECLCLHRAFTRLGVNSFVTGPGWPGWPKALKEKVDVVLWVDNYWEAPIADLKVKKVFWCIDAHCNPDRYAEWAKRQKVDLVLCSSPVYMKRFKKAVWFPNAYPDDLIWDPWQNTAKNYDVGFCGSLTSKRKRWIKELGIHHDYALGPEMLNAISSYSVHWNQSIADDINYRVFETMGLGCCLLTNKVPGLTDLFQPDKHFLMYESVAEAAAMIEWAKANPRGVAEIARSGLDCVYLDHSYETRAMDLVKEIL